ncbi:Protein HOTHEAD, partial [Linum perenne]
GTAGCPLAATLSQNATVLLLERGGSPYGDPNITSEDGVINSRPRVLGGGSCLNAGFYSRAGPDYIRDVGWNAELAESSYEWVEKKVAFQPPMGRWQSAHIYGTKVGGSIFDSAGHRHTAADLLDYANPDRLTVLLKATAHKIMFQTDSAGVKHKAYLNRGAHSEIIISAGSLGSPQLLMLSGVGPTDQLKAHNITVILENSMVGQSMLDNPMNAVFVPSPLPVEVSLIEVVGITHFGSYIEAASGANFGRFPTNDYGFLSPKVMKALSKLIRFLLGFL